MQYMLETYTGLRLYFTEYSFDFALNKIDISFINHYYWKDPFLATSNDLVMLFNSKAEIKTFRLTSPSFHRSLKRHKLLQKMITVIEVS